MKKIYDADFTNGFAEEHEKPNDVLLPLTAAEVFGRYSDMVYRLALSRTKSRDDAEDVMQEVFVRYVRNERKSEGFSGEGHRRAWLLRVTINCSASLLSSLWARRTQPLNEERESEATYEEETSGVYEAVMALPDKYRTILHLFYYEDYSIAETAKLCDIPEATVKTRLHRARAKLQKILEKGRL